MLLIPLYTVITICKYPNKMPRKLQGEIQEFLNAGKFSKFVKLAMANV